jgi:hypothetical protein
VTVPAREAVEEEDLDGEAVDEGGGDHTVAPASRPPPNPWTARPGPRCRCPALGSGPQAPSPCAPASCRPAWSLCMRVPRPCAPLREAAAPPLRAAARSCCHPPLLCRCRPRACAQAIGAARVVTASLLSYLVLSS